MVFETITVRKWLLPHGKPILTVLILRFRQNLINTKNPVANFQLLDVDILAEEKVMGNVEALSSL